jgi:tetratricopeptide (TPR) repeat protein
MRANPDDQASAVSLGQCAIRDEEMVAPGGDSARLAFRTSWNPALRALRRAVQLDPTNGRAYPPLFRMLFAETRDGCSRAAGSCLHVASVIRDNDSLITVPRLVPTNTTPSPYDPFVRETIDRQGPSLTEAATLAQQWARMAPNDFRPHQYHGQALLRLGNFAEAADALERSAELGTAQSRRRLFWDRFEALVKANRGTGARRVLDEAVVDSGRDTTQLRGFTVSELNALVGRLRLPPVDSVRIRRQQARIDSIVRSQPPQPSRPSRREPTVQELLAAGDTAAARRMVVRFDSLMAGPPGRVQSQNFSAHHLQLAELYLALGDTALAEARLAHIERPFHEGSFRFKIASAYGPQPWLGRAWKLSGDLAAARGRPSDARRMYERVVGLWGGGDADLQSVVTEANTRLDALSRR